LTEIVAREAGEDEHVAATRVWAAAECLKKAGASVAVPLTFLTSTDDGWILFMAGHLNIATLTARVRGASEQLLVLAILTGSDGGRCAPTSTSTWSASKRRASPATSTT
jgi:enediyne polyketide synthase